MLPVTSEIILILSHVDSESNVKKWFWCLLLGVFLLIVITTTLYVLKHGVHEFVRASHSLLNVWLLIYFIFVNCALHLKEVEELFVVLSLL